jgi:hypothetical protein
LSQIELSAGTIEYEDTGGALVQLMICDHTARVGRIVVASCDAFDNFPPGLTGKAAVLTGKLPPALFGLFMQQMRLRPLRRLPIAFGWLTKRGDTATARWLQPVLQQRDIRYDTVRVLRAAAADKHLMLDARNACRALIAPPSSSGRAKTASCRSSTDGASPKSSHEDGWSRYQTATRSFLWTSRSGSLESSAISPASRTVLRTERRPRSASLRGHPLGALLGVPPTGNHVQIGGISIFRGRPAAPNTVEIDASKPP